MIFLTDAGAGPQLDRRQQRAHPGDCKGRYPNVKVLDWAGLAVERPDPGMAGDSIHLGDSAAKQTYASYVFDMIGRRDLQVAVPTD
ncbi:MAG: hypothetical protein R2713_20545 [Ilumatobacteraceae bacterium]